MTGKTEYPTASDALEGLAREILADGREVGSRGGRVKELTGVAFSITEPGHRYMLSEGRKASVYAQVAETMWVLAGRSDIEWLSEYLPRAKDFSDDGETWRAAYGPRLRRFGLAEIDQVQFVIDELKRDALSRRAVIALYDPDSDTGIESKDIPCNNWLHFLSREGRLEMFVTTRSNDLIWGWSGINQFEWSVLQEIIAGQLGLLVGPIHYSVSSMHIYERHWKRARGISEPDPRRCLCDYLLPGRTKLSVGQLTSLWFRAEACFRAGDFELDSDLLTAIQSDPLLSEFVGIIGVYWSERFKMDAARFFLSLSYAGQHAVSGSPKVHPADDTEGDPEGDPLKDSGLTAEEAATRLVQAVTGDPSREEFAEYVTDLHSAKHAAYGDSWMKRGEKVSIQANIARKIDRLLAGGETEDENGTDTAVDLFVYLAKYTAWLYTEGRGPLALGIFAPERLIKDPDSVNSAIRVCSKSVALRPDRSESMEISDINGWFEASIEGREAPEDRIGEIGDAAFRIAFSRWLRDKWKRDNENRVWKGYEA